MPFKKYVTRKLSVQKARLSQILSIPQLPNARSLSQIFRHHLLLQDDELPPKVDLRPDMTPIENQLNLGCSVANSLAGAYEYLTKKSTGCDINVSRLFIHYNARVKGNNPEEVEDSGCSMTDAIEALEEYGTCLESVWPYNISRVDTCPSDQAYDQAVSHRTNEALQVNIDLNEMKSCLAQGFPFGFGLQLYTSFNKAAKNGIVFIPSILEQHKQSIGSHAMLAVGYSDRSNAFIVRNSWGEDWGDKGYCYIPYDYITNPNLCFDAWTIRKVDDNEFGREYWHFDDLVNYLSDHTIETANKEEDDIIDSAYTTNWRDYYNRKSVKRDSWDEYQRSDDHQLGMNDDDYLDNRYRRDRYDRDNEPYDQQLRGYTNNVFYANRNLSYPFYDRFQDENNRYDNFDDDDRYSNDHRKSMF